MFKVTEFGENEKFVFTDFSVEELLDFAPWFVSSQTTTGIRIKWFVRTQTTGKDNCGYLE